MTNKMGLGKAGGVEQRHDICGCRSGSIIPPPGRSRSLGVAALARDQRAQPSRFQLAGDRLEADGCCGNPWSSTTAGAFAGPESTTSKRNPGRTKWSTSLLFQIFGAFDPKAGREVSGWQRWA